MLTLLIIIYFFFKTIGFFFLLIFSNYEFILEFFSPQINQIGLDLIIREKKNEIIFCHYQLILIDNSFNFINIDVFKENMPQNKIFHLYYLPHNTLEDIYEDLDSEFDFNPDISITISVKKIILLFFLFLLFIAYFTFFLLIYILLKIKYYKISKKFKKNALYIISH